MTEQAMPGFFEYLRKRDEQRMERVEALLAKMEPETRALVREAAVMGYVQGKQAGLASPRDGDHPQDSVVLVTVIDAILTFPDLYPVTNALEDR